MGKEKGGRVKKEKAKEGEKEEREIQRFLKTHFLILFKE